MTLGAARIALVVAGFGLATPVFATSMLFGVIDGNQGWELARVDAVEAWQGRRHAVVGLYTNWDSDPAIADNLFHQQLPAIWTRGSIPLITWEPFTGSVTARNVVGRVAEGEYDAYVSAWARHLAQFVAGPDALLHTSDDRRAYLRLAHEMNGSWYPWGQALPRDFIAMWRRLHDAFEAEGLRGSHVQWIWCVTNVDTGRYRAESYYPGDAWVDWVAVDGYNWGRSRPSALWQSPASVFGPMVARVRALTRRPLALPEVGSSAETNSGTSVTAKNAWITAFFSWASAADVRMVAWYNLDVDADFAVFGGRHGDEVIPLAGETVRAFSAYRHAVQAAPLIEASAEQPRIVSDAAFAGDEVTE